jgi:hypothetical protein
MILAFLATGAEARRLWTHHPLLFYCLIGFVILYIIWRRFSN